MGLESIQGGEFREHFANISGDPNRESWPIPEAVSIFAPRQTVIALPKRREREKKKGARVCFSTKSSLANTSCTRIIIWAERWGEAERERGRGGREIAKLTVLFPRRRGDLDPIVTKGVWNGGKSQPP